MPFDTTIKKVALAGASGPVGQAIAAELLKSELFDITILTRDSTTYQSLFSPTLKVIQVDYTSLTSLTQALTDQDAVISALSPSAIPTQKLLIDACIQAHVHRFLPSEYSYDFYSPSIHQLSHSNQRFAQKIAIEEYLKEQATHTSLSYTLLFSNPILELSLKNNLFFDFQTRTAILNPQLKTTPISLTTLPSLSKAVRRILTHPRETANRPIRIKDIDISHAKLLSIAQSLTPGQQWDIRTDVSSDSDSSFNFGGNFERVHNSVFGIKEISLEELEELVRVTCEVEKS
ncbi:putative oxidoreductase - protein [Botrytis fragariae]|uniref:Putative oxidoreductase - protein n=1 Tax=Botrytis fragariae TaxID=1964551 RepID=A0A8H6B3V2_9HELO|nr:putative oxidoreductase - protein [Botrytis fragariae]KAF5878680.1 putative oxidoreductase - protein [Botrytis fragariae]